MTHFHITKNKLLYVLLKNKKSLLLMPLYHTVTFSQLMMRIPNIFDNFQMVLFPRGSRSRK